MAKRWKALILAVVPGLGHLYLARYWRGLLLLIAFALTVNAIYAAAVFEAPPVAEAGARATATAVWLYSVVHVAHLGRRRRQPLAERKEYHFKRGLTQYLAGTWDQARGEFLTVLKLDPLDVDARFHLAMTLLRLDDRRQAVKAFKRCLADDIDAKWQWEIKTQLDKLRASV